MRSRTAVLAALALVLGAVSAVPAQAAPKPTAKHVAVAKGTPKVLRGMSRLLTRDVRQADGTTRDETRRVLELPNGRWVDLHVPDKVALSLNAPVELTGVGTDRTLDVSSVRHLRGAEAKTAYAIAQADGTGTAAAAAGQPATGTTSVLVILAYWTQPDSVTTASATNVVFTQGNPWWKEASYGALQLTGRVTGWLRIAPPSSDCYSSGDQIMSRARAAAASYSPSSYQRVIVYFPACQGSPGWAFVGEGSVWINGSMDQRVVIHEQGHNYGLGHAHSYPCTGGTLGGTCTSVEYGDPYDAMGGGEYVGHFSGRHKDLLGWLGNRRVGLTSGTPVTLTPLETATGTKAGVIAAGSGRSYWVEYRTAQGKDKGFPAGAVGVQVRLVSSAIADGGPSLLDAQPGGSDYDPFDTVTIPAGSSWTTPEGIRISVGSVTATGAVVTSLNNAPPPTVPPAPSGVTAKAGDNRATVTWSRPASDGGSLLSGYVVTANPGGRTLQVNSSAGTVLTGSVGGLTNGTAYTFTVQARNAQGLGPSSAASAPVTPTLAVPSVAITSPGQGTVVTGDSVPVTVSTAVSPVSGAALDSVDYSLDGDFAGSSRTAPFSTVLDLSSLQPGEHSLTARVFDVNGRTRDSAPIGLTYAPPAPAVSITSPTKGQVLTGLSADVMMTATPGSPGHPVASVYATLADGTNAGYATPTGTSDGWTLTWYLDGLVNGQTYELTAHATDDTGRVSASAPISVTVQHPVPTVAVTAPAAGAVVNGTGPVVAQIGKALDGDPDPTGAQLVADDVTLLGSLYAGDPAVDPSGAWSFSVDWRSLANGPHTLRVKATNDAGYAALSAPLVVEVSNPSPTAVITSPAVGDTLKGDVTVTAHLTPDGAVLSTATLFAGGNQVGGLTETATPGDWSLTWSTQYLDPGPVAIVVEVVDADGYRGVSPAVTVTLDNPGPSVAVTSPSSGAVVSGQVAVTAATTPGPSGTAISSVEYLLDGSTYGYSTDGGTWPVALDLSYLPAGPHVLKARVTDNDGLTRSSPEVPVSVVTTPDPPAGVSAVYGVDTVDLTWTAPVSTGGVDLTGYVVQRMDDAFSQVLSEQEVPPSQLTSSLTGLTGNTVNLRVLSENSAGRSSYGATVVVDLLPGPVGGLTLTPGAGGLSVGWTGSPATDLYEYDVFVQEGTGVPDLTGLPAVTTAPTATTASLGALADGTAYTVAVVALDNSFGPSQAVVATASTLGRTTLTAAAPASVTYPAAASVTGTLRRAGTGAAVPGAALALQQRKPGGTWTTVGTFTTAANGVATARRVPTAHTEYRWAFAAAGEVAGTSAGRLVKVAPKVTAALSAARVALGRSVVLTGTVAPNHRGQRVYLQQRVGSSWRTVTSAVLSSTSVVRFTVVGRARGTATYRLYKPADADHALGYSPLRSLAVV